MKGDAEANHLMEWIYTISGGAYTVLFLQRATRDELLALLYMATGLLPGDKPPTPRGGKQLSALLCVPKPLMPGS